MRSHSKLLINESPLQALPTLACIVGLDKALILQQIHYLIDDKNLGKIYEEKRWFKNSARKWKENNFPFWSERKISRLLQQLEQDDNLLLSTTDLNTMKYDQEKWYTLDYDRLRFLELEYEAAEKIIDENNEENDDFPIDIDDTPICHQCQLEQSPMSLLYTKKHSKIHSKTTRVLSNTGAQSFLPIDDLPIDDDSNKVPIETTITSKHSNIQLWRKANSRYPNKTLYRYVVNRLGENPNEEVLIHVCKKWDARGYKPTDIDNKLKWYDDALKFVRNGGNINKWIPPQKETRESDKSMPASLGALEI